MVKFEFNLSDADFDRLCEIKKQQGKDDMTLNDFARYLLENELYRLMPRVTTAEEE